TWKFYANSADNIDPANPGATLIGTGTLTFDTNGQLQSVAGGTLTVHRANTGATPILPGQLDFGGGSSLAQDSAHKGSDMEMSSLNVASAGFSASSRVISTSEQLMQELLNTQH